MSRIRAMTGSSASRPPARSSHEGCAARRPAGLRLHHRRRPQSSAVHSTTTGTTPMSCPAHARSSFSIPARAIRSPEDPVPRRLGRSRRLLRRLLAVEHRRVATARRYLHVDEPEACGSTFVVVRTPTPDDPQDFYFTAGGGQPLQFQLDDDGDNTNGLSNTPHFDNVCPVAATRCQRPCPPGGPSPRPPARTDRDLENIDLARRRSSPARSSNVSPTAGPDHRDEGRAARRPAGLRLHRRQAASARPRSSSTTTATTPTPSLDTSGPCLRFARVGLLAGGDCPERLVPDIGDVLRRLADLEHRRVLAPRRSPATSRTKEAATIRARQGCAAE